MTWEQRGAPGMKEKKINQQLAKRRYSLGKQPDLNLLPRNAAHHTLDRSRYTRLVHGK